MADDILITGMSGLIGGAARTRFEWSYRDLSHARAVLGFVPQDAAEDHRR